MARIAYITADRGIPVFGAKGASIHVREMVRAFAAEGHEVVVFAGRVGQPAPLPAEIVKVRAAEGFAGSVIGLDGDDRQRAKEVHAQSLSVAVERAVAESHRARPFDFVYERYGLFSTAGIRIARLLGIPCLVEVNAPLVEEQGRYRKLLDERAARQVEADVFGDADRLLCVSREVAAYAISRGADARVVEVVPNAVDPEHFSPDVPPAAVPGDPDLPVIGFSGSLKPWHGLEILLEAFRELARGGVAARLLVVGEGPLRDWINGFAAGAGLADRVTVTGWVDYAELPAWLSAMDIAVAPYPPMVDFYFSPLKLTEYLASGRAVVASDIGQIARQMHDGVNGRLVTPGNVGELADAIGELIASPAARAALGAAGREAVGERSWRATAARVAALGLGRPMLATRAAS